MRYVLKLTKSGEFLQSKFGTTHNLQEARLFDRRCDAKNSLNNRYVNKSSIGYEIIPVKISFFDYYTKE
jgi:hypothetical protein